MTIGSTLPLPLSHSHPSLLSLPIISLPLPLYHTNQSKGHLEDSNMQREREERKLGSSSEDPFGKVCHLSLFFFFFLFKYILSSLNSPSKEQHIQPKNNHDCLSLLVLVGSFCLSSPPPAMTVVHPPLVSPVIRYESFHLTFPYLTSRLLSSSLLFSPLLFTSSVSQSFPLSPLPSPLSPLPSPPYTNLHFRGM